MLTAIRHLSALAVSAAAIWLLATSSSFNSCIERQTTTLIEQAKEKSQPTALSFVDRAAICGRCAWHVTVEYRDALTAIATVFIALFTFTLWHSTDRMMAATQTAVDLARRDFIATHRPRVIVRYIEGPFYDDDGHRIAFVTLVNTGASDALIEAGTDLALRRDEDDKWEPPGLDAGLKTIEPIVLTCGQRHVIKVTVKTFDGIDKARSPTLRRWNHQIPRWRRRRSRHRIFPGSRRLWREFPALSA
jgi:hypothetical protein